MRPVDDIIFIAKDNPSPASQVGHIARYLTKLGEGYILIYYLLFIYFKNITVFSAVLCSILSFKSLIKFGLLWLGQNTCNYSHGMVGAADAASLPCVYVPYGTDWLCSGVAGRGFLDVSWGRREDIALLSKTSGNNGRAQLAAAQR